MDRFNSRKIIIVEIFILLLGLITICNSTIVLESYSRRGPNPSITDTKCRIAYYTRTTEMNITVPPSYGTFTAEYPLTIYSHIILYQLTNYTLVSEFTIDFPQNWSKASLTLYVVSQNVNNTIIIPLPFSCNPMPAALTIDRISTLARVNYVTATMYYTLNQDLTVFTDNGSVIAPPRCTSLNRYYTCYVNNNYRGNHMEYMIELNTGVTTLFPNYTLQTPTSLFIDYYFPTLAFSIVISIPNPMPTFFPSSLTIMNPSYLYPGQTYVDKGHGLSTITQTNATHMTYPLVTFGSKGVYPVLGSTDTGALYNILSTTSSTVIYQLSEIPVKLSVFSNLYSIVSYPNVPLSFGLGSVYNGNQLLVEMVTVFPFFAPIQSISYSQSSIPSYPFGFTKGGSTPQYNVTFQWYQTGTTAMYLKTVFNGTGSFNAGYPPSIELMPPVLNWIELTTTIDKHYFIFNATDYSGLMTFAIQSFVGTAHKYLVKGDLYSGVYMVGIPINQISFQNSYTYPSILLTDQLGVSKTYNGACYNNKGNSTTPFSFSSILSSGPWDLNLVQFTPNDINTSAGPVNVTMLFNATSIDVNYEPLITFSYGLDKYPFFLSSRARWDYTDKVYRTDFTLPSRLMNTSLAYEIDGYQGTTAISGFLGKDAELRVYSNYTDTMAPMVTNITQYPSSSVMSDSTDSIGFLIYANDEVSGINEGYATIISSLDAYPRKFIFGKNAKSAGTVNNRVFNISIPVNSTTCMTQTYYIGELVLVDNNGYKSVYPPVDGSNLPNSLLYITALPNITLICYTTTDMNAPTITTLLINPKSIDITSPLNRTVDFEVTVNDAENGLSASLEPRVYLSEFMGDIITVAPYNHSFTDSRDLVWRFRTEIPPMFGYGNITVSVYGLLDITTNLGGYSTSRLKSSGFDYMIQTTYQPNQPLITNSSRVYIHGGEVTIYGFGFGDGKNGQLVMVDYRDGKGYVQVPINRSLYTFMYIQLKKMSSTQYSQSSSYIKVQVINGKFVSNEYLINITQYYRSVLIPINPIPCISQCSGHGNCTVNGCICNDPWSGPDCSSKPIIIPPVTNTTDPVIVIDTSGNGTSTFGFKTVIAIYSIRELSISGDTVIEYFPSKWTFTNQTNDIHASRTDGVESQYHYSTQLNNTSTLFNVTIQYFINQSVVVFAGQSISLPPYSTKISLDLTSYPFQSTLNTLQIIFKIGFTSKQGGECLDKQFGLGNGNDLNDLQWMKLNIDDKSLYGNFIRKAIVDGRYIAIRNSLLDISKGDESQSYIGINVPQYDESVYLDPSFSHLVDLDSSSKSQCANTNNDNKKLSMGAIAGIVIAAVVAAAVGISTFMYLKKTSLKKKEKENIQAKLKRFSK